jgi:hypothetical protein
MSCALALRTVLCLIFLLISFGDSFATSQSKSSVFSKSSITNPDAFGTSTGMVVAQTSSPTVAGTTHPLPEQEILDVHQDPESGLLSIRANKVNRGQVMKKISKVTGLTVQSLDDDILRTPFEVNLKRLPLKQIIDRLLNDLNTILIYSSPPETANANGVSKLVKVLILSRKKGMTSGLKVVGNEDSDKTGKGVRVVLNSELGRAILGNKTSATRRILKALIESDTQAEREKAIEDLGRIMLDPSLYNQAGSGHLFYEALNALKQLNPESGEGFLTRLLETGEEAWVQSLAAQNLGELGSESSVDTLLSAFTSDNTLVRNAAIDSLAKIGDSRGINQLLQMATTGDSALQEFIVHAMAFAGDINSRAALRQAIATNRIPAEAVSQEVLNQLAQ